MKRIHIALGVKDIVKSVEDYSQRLGCTPSVVIPNEYALWRTPTLNFSIRLDPENAGKLRHLGWEDESAPKFTKETDVNGVVWENFNSKQQEEEISDLWPE
jgi:hypothetical protein